MSIRPEIFIGIDPDVNLSGFAVWDGNRFNELTCLSLWDVFTSISAYGNEYRVLVRLESGWLAKGKNWHKSGGLGAANDVGRNHEIGRQIEKYCIAHAIPYQLVMPQGYSSWTHDKFCTYTGWDREVRTNSDNRVAAMMVWQCT